MSLPNSAHKGIHPRLVGGQVQICCRLSEAEYYEFMWAAREAGFVKDPLGALKQAELRFVEQVKGNLVAASAAQGPRNPFRKALDLWRQITRIGIKRPDIQAAIAKKRDAT